MPSSHHYQLNEIIDLIIRTNPKKILDIGVGFGKYGFLSREYLELWNGSEKYDQWQRQIDGIEAFKEYITPAHRYIYNRIFIGDALKILPEITDQYDLVLLIDVLEHFNFEDGSRILGECRRISANILVSVPKVLSVQDEAFGNPYEVHKNPWKKKELAAIGNAFFINNPRSFICFTGIESNRLKKEIRNFRARQTIIHILDWLHIKKIVKTLPGVK